MQMNTMTKFTQPLLVVFSVLSLMACKSDYDRMKEDAAKQAIIDAENYRLNKCRSYALHPEFISQASLDKYKCNK
jgi:hypothetical protein